jgi:iron complex outermembrane receptor protein
MPVEPRGDRPTHLSEPWMRILLRVAGLAALATSLSIVPDTVRAQSTSGTSEGKTNSEDGSNVSLPPLKVTAPDAQPKKKKAAQQSNTSATPANAVAKKEKTETSNSDSVAPTTAQATGPANGYVARATTTGSKTPTDILDIPFSVSVVTRAQMDDRQPAQLEDTLAYTPGVTSSIWGTDDRFDQFLIRGFDIGTSGIYRDGLSQKAIDFSGFKIEPYSLERVEVLKGPSGVLYGENDVGGMINAITKRPTFDTIKNAYVSYGSFDTVETGMDVGGAISSELAFRLTGVYRDGATEVEGSENDRAFIAPSLTWKPSDKTTLTILANYQDDKLTPNSFLPVAGLNYDASYGALPKSFVFGQSDFNKFDASHGSIGYQFEHEFNSAWTVRQNLRYAEEDTNYKHFYFNGMTSATNMDYVAFTVDETAKVFNVDNQVQNRARFAGIDNTLLVGFDYSRYSVDGKNGWVNGYSIDITDPSYDITVTDPAIYLDRVQTINRYGIYTQNQSKILDHWNLTLGLRQSWIDNTTNDRLWGADSSQKDDALTGMAGLGYSFDNGVTPYVSYSESFTTNPGGSSVVPVYEPSEGQQYEAGIKYRPLGTNALFTAALFDITKTNVITGAYPNQVQTGEVNHRGLELEANFDLITGISVTAGYTYLDAEITSSEVMGEEGNRPSLVPEHQASLWANYKFEQGALNGLSLGAGVRYIGQSYGDNANALSVPSYITVDSAVRYKWSNYEAALNATNLLDEEYYSTCYTGSGCILGEGRVLKGTLSAKF